MYGEWYNDIPSLQKTEILFKRDINTVVYLNLNFEHSDTLIFALKYISIILTISLSFIC